MTARAGAFVALALFAGLHWMRLLEPAAGARALAAVGAALLAVAALSLVHRHARRLRVALSAAVAVAALVLALLAGGVPPELLKPSGWSELAGALSRGITSLPGARVPYRGLDEWTRIVIATGGALLVVVAALLAFWPRGSGRPRGWHAAALVVLVAVYAVPGVALDADGEFVRGAVLALLVLAFARLERLRWADSRVAAGLATGAAALALAAAPVLDADEPWWDYEHWALSAASSRTTTFTWEHDYGPLDWPRDGREILRVKAREGAYWKADALDGYDGQRWVHAMLAINEAPSAHVPVGDRVERWTRRIRVTLRNLRSRTFVTAGTPLFVRMPRRITIPTGIAGVFTSQRTLRRGDSYEALVYVPRPGAAELRTAGSVYDFSMRSYLSFTAIVPSRGPAGAPGAYVVQPAPFASGERHGLALGADDPEPPAYRVADLMPRSTLRRTWALAQRLRRDAETPYDVVEAIEAHLREGYRYTETPDPASQTLEGFLFDAREGYCQQFSGAMALLLRMAGIPARVATGFSPGTRERDTGEWVVRDLDAHSWVEAWFPDIGWVPFDPTPAASPARRQADAIEQATAAVGDVDDLAPGDSRAPVFSSGAPTADEATTWPLWLGGALAAAALLTGLVALRRRRPATLLDELERALRRAGRPAPPGATLRGLEGHLGPGAGSAYVRALREQRYAPAGAGPSRRERRALRAALAERRGPLARLKAWWALPPRRLHSAGWRTSTTSSSEGRNS